MSNLISFPPSYSPLFYSIILKQIPVIMSFKCVYFMCISKRQEPLKNRTTVLSPHLQINNDSLLACLISISILSVS